MQETKAVSGFSSLESRTSPVDWNRIWNHHIQRYRRTNGGRDCADQWKSRESALAYWEMACQTQQKRIEKTLSEIPLFPGCRVLDIGSGPGVMAIPIARQTSHVTAVDASEGMISVLKEKASEEGVNNIDCVKSRWEEVDPEKDLSGPYDIVLASLSLAMYDIRAAVSRMEKVCRGQVILYWFDGEASWEGHRRLFEPFAPKASSKIAVPKSDLLLNVLRQKGINPRLKQFKYVHLDRFQCIDEAVRYFARRFRIPPEHQTNALKQQVSDLLEARNGAFVLRSEAACMKIWWNAPGRNPGAGATEKEKPLWWN